MDLLQSLLRQLFGKEQCGGETMAVSISMVSPIHCSKIIKVSTCGGDVTGIAFDPPLPLEEALLHSRHYKNKGSYTHTNH